METKEEKSNSSNMHENKEETVQQQLRNSSKVAVQNLRKAHASWDRNSRDMRGLVKQSQDNPNTANC
eukprot:3073544-Lingulodinium_polyedra.AAC.1